MAARRAARSFEGVGERELLAVRISWGAYYALGELGGAEWSGVDEKLNAVI